MREVFPYKTSCFWLTASPHIEGILSKGPYPPCLRMADRALLAGYPRYMSNTSTMGLNVFHCCHNYDLIFLNSPFRRSIMARNDPARNGTGTGQKGARGARHATSRTATDQQCAIAATPAETGGTRKVELSRGLQTGRERLRLYTTQEMESPPGETTDEEDYGGQRTWVRWQQWFVTTV